MHVKQLVNIHTNISLAKNLQIFATRGELNLNLKAGWLNLNLKFWGVNLNLQLGWINLNTWGTDFEFKTQRINLNLKPILNFCQILPRSHENLT